jgi:hypothetical protein
MIAYQVQIPVLEELNLVLMKIAVQKNMAAVTIVAIDVHHHKQVLVVDVPHKLENLKLIQIGAVRIVHAVKLIVL